MLYRLLEDPQPGGKIGDKVNESITNTVQPIYAVFGNILLVLITLATVGTICWLGYQIFRMSKAGADTYKDEKRKLIWVVVSVIMCIFLLTFLAVLQSNGWNFSSVFGIETKK
ncbi:hypothetical protein [Mycoplasmopsis primatum]|uniref:hypothetical protein n=1 Tax=Mycoplasmopsis primatum TaxID=55604 RepID=UPI0004979FE8|nr:hypothetical protein [Mycoplasmopsis primatum]